MVMDRRLSPTSRFMLLLIYAKLAIFLLALYHFLNLFVF